MAQRIETDVVLEWADRAAAYGGFGRALAWLNTVRVIDGKVPDAYATKRSAWARARVASGALAAARSPLLTAPAQTRRMVMLSQEIEGCRDMRAVLDGALDGAMALLETGLGNVQTRDPTTGALTIEASSGFGSEFLEYFAIVEDGSSACGRAMRLGSQTVIADVGEDPAFAPHREIAAASRFCAVQSTPLVCPAGRLHGVISTHSDRPRRWSPPQLQLIALYGERIAAAITRCDELSGGELVSFRPIELSHVLSVLLDFGGFDGASPELVAWELGASEELVRELWPRLVHENLIEPTGVDRAAGEAMWRLTEVGLKLTLATG